MALFSRKRLIIISLILLPLLAAGGWFYSRRAPRAVLAAYVPESALGYLEINDWPRLLDQLTATDAWRRLAPAYGISDKLSYAGKAGWLAQFGVGEAALLARAQFALVVTGLEVRGEEVKPRLALIAETHGGTDELRQVIAARLPQLVARIFPPASSATSEYGGVPITTFRAAAADGGERQLLSAQIAGAWLVANHEEALRGCIDARLGRAPALTNNFYLQNARTAVTRAESGGVFGFVTGAGLTRLVRFGTFLLAGGPIGKAALAGAMEEVFTEFSARAVDGFAYGLSFERGQVADRYAVLCKPPLVEALAKTIKVNPREPRLLGVVPAAVSDVTFVNVEEPGRALAGIETAVSAQIGVAQSFLLHHFVLGARENFFGLQGDESIAPAVGNELASFAVTGEIEERVWLLAVRDRALLTKLVERFLTRNGAFLVKAKHADVEIIGSSSAARGAAAFVGEDLALGPREQLMWLIDALRRGKPAHRFDAGGRLAPLLSFSVVAEESGAMMTTIAAWTGSAAPPADGLLEQLPPAVTATTLNGQGILVEGYAPFGNFPFFIALANGAVGGAEAGK